MSQIKNTCKKFGVDPNSDDVKAIKDLLGNKLGYFPVFARWLFDDDIFCTTTIEELRELIVLLNEIKISKAIGDFQYSEDLYDFLSETKNRRKLNQIVKSIPSHSRRNISDRIKEIMYTNIEKVELFKDYFSKKGGSCKSEEELYQKCLEIIKESESSHSYKDIISKVEKTIDSYGNSDIIFRDGVTIIARIDSYSVSKNLGSNHWCISNQETYWNNYTRDDRTQYFIWQTELDPTDKKSMIGVTVDSFANKIYAAHLKDDRSCDHKYLSKFRGYLTGSNKPISDISVLIKHDIFDISMFFKTDNWRSAFTMKSASRYLGELSYNIYEQEIGKNNVILNLGHVVNEVNEYNITRSEIKTRGVSTHSKYDMNNEYFQNVLKHKRYNEKSLYTLCALIDEDTIEDVDLRETIIKAKIAFIINMGVLSGLVNNEEKQKQLNEMKKKVRYSNFGHRQSVSNSSKEDEKHYDKLKKEIGNAINAEKVKYRKVVDHLNEYFNYKNQDSRLRLEWVTLSESDKLSFIRRHK